MANFTPQEIEEMLQEFFDVTGKRQYVGARYVPIFGRKGESSIDWNNSAPYEPLTVVMNNGISYVSKQYVPAGIEITDTGYWAETYRFNAQVEQYRQEVLSFQAQIDELKSDLESDYVPFPDGITYPKYGVLGQVLTTLSDGETKWEDPVTVDSEIAEPLINDWLDAHPEATTTVQDNSLTTAKYQDGSVTTPKIANSSVTPAKLDYHYTLMTSGDLNDAPAGTVNLANAVYTNLPSEVIGNPTGVLTTYEYQSWPHKNQVLFCTITGQLFLRFYNGSSSTWSDWKNLSNVTKVLPNNTDLNSVSDGSFVLYNHYAYTNLPDTSSHTGILQAFLSPTDNTIIQTYHNQSGGVWMRFRYNGTWRNWVNQFAASEISANTDLNDITSASTRLISNANAPTISNIPDIAASNKTGVLRVSKVIEYTNACVQSYEAVFSGETFYRFRYDNGTWGPWSYDIGKKEISILFVGNSLQQDAVTYLPYILKTYFPTIRFKLYIWYIGAANCATHFTAFNNNTPCDIFSVCENGIAWTNYQNSVTMNSILSTYKFDVVSIMEYFSNRTTFTIADIGDWVNCANYIAINYQGGNGLMFTSWFQTPRIEQGYNPDLIFSLNKTANDLFLQNTVCEDVISPGIAMHRARETSLNNIGDAGGLTPDGVHAQEGLPCLMEAFVVLLWILNKLGITKSIFGSPMRMTSSLFNTLNIPGPNLGTGVIQGTGNENRLAQEVAIKAFKEGEYYVINGLFNPQP